MQYNNWKTIPWITIKTKVHTLQQNIYLESKNGNHAKVLELQNTLVNSNEAKLLAVKRVTQDNRGKKTAGIDKVKNLTPPQRLKLASKISLDGKAFPIRRVLIDKPGTNEKRPLGIPVIRDRAKQALALLALEPQWEARFETHSYGFRPGRRAMDATWQIKNKLKYGTAYVYDADVEKCFDRIDHGRLLNKLDTIPSIKITVEAWLKAGIFFNGKAYPNPGQGTPQGGVISPLLANIALDGMQSAIWNAVYKLTGNKKKAEKVLYIRYADDFVILSPEREWLDTAIDAVKTHLKDIGLNIKETKTRILHTIDKSVDPKTSFDFLGFTFQQIIVSSHKSTNLGRGRSINLKTIVRPAKKKVKNHMEEIYKALKHTTTAINIIRKLNPMIRGWRNYFKYSDARTYGSLPTSLDMWINAKLRDFVKRRYLKYGKHPRFWTRKWVFFAKDDNTGTVVYLARYASVSWSLQSYNRIDPKKSPYDGDYGYWANHTGNMFFNNTIGVSYRTSILIKRQKGLCPICRKPFSAEELAYAEVDHIKPKAKGGKNEMTNLRLLHKECHHQITYGTDGESSIE